MVIGIPILQHFRVIDVRSLEIQSNTIISKWFNIHKLLCEWLVLIYCFYMCVFIVFMLNASEF